MQLTKDRPQNLFRVCRFQGNLWHITFEDKATVHLTSYDGKLYRPYISKSQIQILDEFQDSYPEE